MSQKRSLLALEEEIKALEAAAYGTQEEVEEVEEEEVEEEVVEEEAEEQPAKPLNTEEETFKKRYSDLRRHSSKQAEDLKALTAKVAEMEARTSDPAMLTKEEVLEWAEKNPQAAATIRALASEQVSRVAPKADEVEAIKAELQRTKELAVISKVHPDFEDVTTSDEFQDWADAQTTQMKGFIYSEKAEDVIFVLNTYKGLKKAPVKPTSDKAAASAVSRKGGAAEPVGTPKKSFSESQVRGMTLSEYEANQDAIQSAMAEGRFNYDLSGGAR